MYSETDQSQQRQSRRPQRKLARTLSQKPSRKHVDNIRRQNEGGILVSFRDSFS